LIQPRRPAHSLHSPAGPQHSGGDGIRDEPKPARESILTLTGPAVEVEGDAWLLVYRVGSQIEITVTEEKGGDSSVLLSKEQARELARAITAALDNPKNL
jgi:hypothetical protein